MGNPAPSTSIAEALTQAKAMGMDRLDAQLLLAWVVQQSRTWLLAHDHTQLTPAEITAWNDVRSRRTAGEPMAYLLGEKEFHGLRLRVCSEVLVPRPDTEILVDWALELLHDESSTQFPGPARVIDLGTGSGAIALAIKHGRPMAHVTATDISNSALQVALGNAQVLKLDLHLKHGSWWHAVPGEYFHLALSNPPYIRGQDEHLDALKHEPRIALTPEGDGLQALRDIIETAPAHLAPGGWLLLEHGHDQGREVADFLRAAGFKSVAHRLDLSGHTRCTGARYGHTAPVCRIT